MQKTRRRLLVAGVASSFAVGLALAYYAGHAQASGVPSASPGALTYTGSLLTFGLPDNNSHTISVALFPNGTSTAACSSVPATIQLVNGQFTVPLPSTCVTAIHQDPNVQVQVTIDTTVLGMTSIAAVPYAMEAASVSATPLLSNLGLSAAFASSALTITLTQNDGMSTPTATNPVIIGFRSPTAASGAPAQVQVIGATSITVPSGATLGQISGNTENTYVYAQDNSSPAQLCVSTSANYDEGVAQTSTTIGTGSTVRSGLYCTAGAIGPVRLIGRITATEATAGTWASVSTNLALPPFTHVPSLTTQVFTSSGTFNVPPTVYTVELLVVAGGGGGGSSGGGGGGGGMIYMVSTPVTPGSAVAVAVGPGGGGGTGGDVPGVNGTNSSFGSIVAIGGGGGGASDSAPKATVGGSGGGGGQTSSVLPELGAAGTSGQGNHGGSVDTNGSPYPAAGGGGAGSPGFPPNGALSGDGGGGLACAITGTSVTYAGGGGGALPNNGTGAGNGGSGGGGSGANPGNPGTANTGGGGGGGNSAGGGAGGSGIVVVRYQI